MRAPILQRPTPSSSSNPSHTPTPTVLKRTCLPLPSIHPGIALIAWCATLSGVAGATTTNTTTAPATEVDWYASLRVQAESVHPDHRDALARYTGLRDAYSRVGVSVRHQVRDGIALTGQLELPVDVPNLSLQDPYDQGDAPDGSPERLRIARVGVQAPWGTLHWGQQWMPYYNAISAPVDAFSSYYSGFATYTVFRVRHTVAYNSPEFQGFSVSAAYAPARGNRRSTSRIDDERVQMAVTYQHGHTRLAVAMDDRGDAGTGRNRLYGLSASHAMGAWQWAAKYERFDTNNHTPGSFSRDGNQAASLLVTHRRGANTLKAMWARVAGYGEHIVHLGIDHQHDAWLKVFLEYYREAETAALTSRGDGLSGLSASTSGGHAWILGLRRDF